MSARARVLRLRVDRRSGEVVLTVPRGVSRRKAIEWAGGHRAWVERQLASIAPAEPLGHGSVIPVRGEPHRVDWDPARPRSPSRDAGRILVGGPQDRLENVLLRWLKQEALNLLGAETAEFAAKAGVRVTKVGVGDPVSRWGSCSSTGAIRYSWRLLLAPDFVRRATVAHEVAHRVHMNHGPDFHNLVEALLGTDPKPARSWLRSHGAALHRVAGARALPG